MLKQSANRSQRLTSFKVKHFLQICVLLAVGIWLLNQLNNTYNKQNADQHITSAQISRTEHEIVSLGRKGLHPGVDETALMVDSGADKAELPGETEEIKPDNEIGADNETDGHDRERAEEEESEEVEDLIDVEDTDRDTK